MSETSAEQVVAGVVEGLTENKPLWLCTVLSTWGSSPRPPGSMMLWSAARGVIGSVSGGCVEEDLIEKFKSGHYLDSAPAKIIYGASENDEEDFKLPCGGQLHLLLEPLKPDRLSVLWTSLLSTLHSRRGVRREVDVVSGDWHWDYATPFALTQNENLANIYLGPSHKLLIVGANQISEYLADFARSLEFAVAVCDPNPDLGPQWKDKNFELIQRFPDGVVAQKYCDPQSAVVAVSHDPRIDDMALLEALPGDAFYIGAMGSQNSSQKRRQRLLQLGVPEHLLKKLRAPIGLDIGSKSPAEIAVSIAADLVRASKKKLGANL